MKIIVLGKSQHKQLVTFNRTIPKGDVKFLSDHRDIRGIDKENTLVLLLTHTYRQNPEYIRVLDYLMGYGVPFVEIA